VAEIAAVILGVAFLYVFYRAVETSWPTSYYSVGQRPDQTISRSLVAYLIFRFGPIYITCVFAGAVLSEQGYAVVWPVILIAGLHALLTSGRALVGLIRSGAVRRRPLVTALHIGVIVLALLVGIAAALSASTFEDYVPSNSEVATALWTALIAGVVATFLVRVTTAPAPDISATLGRSRARIPDHLWQAAEDAAIAAKAEPRLVHAFMLVENVQRPRWTQLLERQAGRLLRRGSYGPLQVTAGSPLTDQAALTIAIEQRFTGRTVPRRTHEWGESIDSQWLKFFAMSYNPDPTYAQDIESAYSWIEYPSTQAIAMTEARALDNLPEIELLKHDGHNDTVTLAGTAYLANGELSVRLVDATGRATHSETVRLSGSQRQRWQVSFTTPPGTVNVELSPGNAEGSAGDATIILPT
jgi:hypothetical protein